MPDPSAPPIEFFTRAEELYDQGYLDSAITAYRRGLEKDPGNMVAINNLAMVYIEKELYDDARHELERALEKGGEDAELLSNLGYVLRKQGNDIAAADVYERYLKAAPDAEDKDAISQWMAKVRAEAPAAEAAAPTPVQEVPAALTPAAPEPAQEVPAALTPAAPPPPAPEVPAPGGGDEQALLAQAEAAFDEERYDDAIALYDQALTVNLESAAALAGRGRAQAKAGLHEEGLASLREAAQMEPDNADTQYVMGFILRALGRDAEAVVAYRAYLKLAPDAENADKIRGWIEQVEAEQGPVATPGEEASAEEGKLKIDKQPVWAAALEEPPEEYQNLGGLELAPVEEEQPAGAAPGQPETPAAPGGPFGGQPEVPAAPGGPFGGQPEVPAAPGGPVDGQPEAPAAPGGPFGAQPAPPPAEEEAAPAVAPPVEEEAPAAESGGADAEMELEAIRSLLADGDAAAALAKAQQLVGQNPGLSEAKVLIARCFGQQGEFGKAQAILKTVLSSEETDEAYFFLGRCQQELGQLREARQSFERCCELTDSPELRERVQGLIQEMETADRGLCGTCGQSVSVQELEDVNGQKMCSSCRSKIEESMGGAVQIAGAEGEAGNLASQQRARKPSKPRPRKKGGVMVATCLTLLLAPFAVVGGALVGGYFALPNVTDLANELWALQQGETPPAPANLPPRQPTPVATAAGTDAGATTTDIDQQGTGTKTGTGTASQFMIDSPPVSELMIGVEYSHRVHAAGKPRGSVEYGVGFSRPPKGRHSFDAKQGLFKWRPVNDDLKEGPLTITFTARSGEEKALEQTNEVRFRESVRAQHSGQATSALPGEAVCLAAGDMNGDGKDDVLVARGKYWSGSLHLYLGTDDGLKEASKLDFAGRPVGLAIGNFGDGKTKAMVVDYWQRSIFYVSYDGGALTRLPAELELPGRPALVAFGNPDGKGPMGAAILFPAEEQILVYDAAAGGSLDMLREVSLPAAAAWKSLQLVDLHRKSDQDTWQELALLRLGTRQPNLYIIGLQEEREWNSLNVGSGVTQVAAVGDIAGTGRTPLPDIAIVTGGRKSELHAFPGQPHGQNRLARPLDLPLAEPVFAMRAADIDGNGADDLVIFFQEKILFQLRSPQGENMRLATAWMKDKVAPALGPTAVGEFTGDKSQDIVYLDRQGRLVLVTTPERR